MKKTFLAIILFIVMLAPIASASYAKYQTIRANRIVSTLKFPDKLRQGDCNFCYTGWYYIFADCWTYLDPITEYTNHYQERCSITGCIHECTATREVPSGNVIGIWDCHILVGSCTGCL